MLTRCPTCGHIEAITEAGLGQVGECPKCHHEFIIERTAPQHPKTTGGTPPSKPPARQKLPGSSTAPNPSNHWDFAIAAFSMAVCTFIWGRNIQIPILATFGVPLTMLAIKRCWRSRSTYATAFAVLALLIFILVGYSSRGDLNKAARSLESRSMMF